MTKEKIIAFIKSLLWMFAKKRGVNANTILAKVNKAKAKADKSFEALKEGMGIEIEKMEENERQLFLAKSYAKRELEQAKAAASTLYHKIGD